MNNEALKNWLDAMPIDDVRRKIERLEAKLADLRVLERLYGERHPQPRRAPGASRGSAGRAARRPSIRGLGRAAGLTRLRSSRHEPAGPVGARSRRLGIPRTACAGRIRGIAARMGFVTSGVDGPMATPRGRRAT